ncbi:MAG: AmmeMemoRadiSam system radical SAM enzyme [Deltaproteobacteria bacterium]|nr:AmmeMemoRadiSam system radical SAM enzyme [Deltaproteobacteria bacterium]
MRDAPYVGRWWERLDEERIVCNLCPRHCKVKDGQRAFCFVRQNVGGQMILTTYGRSTGFCIDPIEKKPLNHFYPGSAVLSFGTAGCNLGCRFCQNWDISKAREVEILSQYASPELIAAAAVEQGCRSVAFTYNDPVIFAEYAIDTAKACHERGIKTVAVTSGYITPEARGEFYAHMDAANVDLKAFTETFYEKLCFAELAPILDTLSYLRRETQVWFEVTTLLIPGQNDSEEEVAKLCDWFVRELGDEVPLHFTAFHPDFKMLDLPPTPPSTLFRARRQALSAGLKHVYTGNVLDREGQSTYCAGCGALLIERSGYTLGTWALTDEGRCQKCSRALPGRFAARPGAWGARRQPVRFHSDA